MAADARFSNHRSRTAARGLQRRPFEVGQQYARGTAAKLVAFASDAVALPGSAPQWGKSACANGSRASFSPMLQASLGTARTVGGANDRRVLLVHGSCIPDLGCCSVQHTDPAGYLGGATAPAYSRELSVPRTYVVKPVLSPPVLQNDRAIEVDEKGA